MAQRILVIDDNEDIRQLLAIRLRLDGYECIDVGENQDIAGLVMSEAPDLLITDLMMNNPDGYEVCRRVREFSAIPIIVFTSATVDASIRANAVTAGANLVMSKLIRPTELLTEIDNLLQV